MRLLAQHRDHRDHRDTRKNDYRAKANGGSDDTRSKNHVEVDADNEDLEFNVTEDLLNFFETSERHKREMRRKYGSNTATCEDNLEGTPFVGAAESARMRKEEVELLYGDASSKILAMETALQSTVERYEDAANPQYWPNIPLKS